MKADLYTKTGTKSESKVELPDYIFSQPVNETLIRQAVRVYKMNQSQTNAHTKGRSDVRGGGKKPWANNKISRARTRSLRNPIFKGGGVVFGPLSIQNNKRSLPKKMRKAAIFSTLSLRNSEKAVIVFEGFGDKEVYKTKDLKKVFEKMPLEGKVLFVLPENNKALVKTAKGIQGVDPTLTTTLNVYDILNHDTILLLEESVNVMKGLWGEGSSTKTSVKVETKVEKKVTPKDTKKVEETKKPEKNESGLIEDLDVTDSIKEKLVEAKIDSKEKLDKVVSGDIKVAGVGAKTLETIKKSL